MAFVDFSFYLFVLLVCVGYFVAPRRFRWMVLLLGSCYYYYSNSSSWLLLVLFLAATITFYAARRIEAINNEVKGRIAQGNLTRAEKKEMRAEAKNRCKPVLLLGIFVDLGMLLFLKYYNFFADNVNVVLSHAGGSLPQLHLLLPLGISFYTLQAIAYLTDVYRGKCEADTNLAQFFLFMSFFPQIVQGPIPRYSQLAKQLYEPHDFDYRRMCHGCQLILWGLFQKIVIADRLAIPVNQIYDNFQDYSGLLVFLGAAGYGLQVYTDFSGGMDIARGISQILGIELELNFMQPYFARSIEEFWRRWHISLGQWMRNYVFYPLSLSKLFAVASRKSRKVLGDFVGKRLPPICAMFVVYVLVGLWHGPEWKYIAYGIWNGIFIVAGILLPETYNLILGKLHIDQDSEGWRLFQIFRTFCICTLGRLFSRGNGLRAALHMFGSITNRWYDLSFIVDGTFKTLGLNTANWIVLGLCVIVLIKVDSLHEAHVHIRDTIERQHIFFRWIIYLGAIAALLVFGYYGPSYNGASFIYEQF